MPSPRAALGPLLARGLPAALCLLAFAACDDDAADPDLDAIVDATVDGTDATVDGTDATVDAITDATADADPPDAGPVIPPYDAPAEPIEIIVDRHGLAHVYAQNDLDLMFGAGYRQAVDRLFAVDMSRRQATGRLAEVFGPDGRSGDLQARVIGFPRLARLTLERIADARPDDAALFAAFAGGLNRRVAEIRAGDAPAPPAYAALGFAPEPFEPAELLAIGVRITFGFSSTLEQDLLNTLLGRLAPGAAELPVFEPVGDAYVMDPTGERDAMPKRARARGVPSDAMPLDPSAIDPAAIDPAAIDPALAEGIADFVRRWRRDLDVGDGSNCWVVSGEHTDDGRPILANDSHATYLDPNVMYPVHLSSVAAGGRWDAIGMSFTGLPGVHVGHNARVVWGATTHFADMLDLWDVDVDDDGALIGDARVPVEAIDETIRVRQPDGTFTDEVITVRTVPGYGVILPPAMFQGIPINLVARGSLLMRWPGIDPGLDALSYFDMARSADVDAWADGVRLQTVGMQNWMAADAQGIRYVTSGRVPDRGPVEGRPRANRVMDAADPTTIWTRGWFAMDRLPALDGSQPYLYSANNDPWGHTADNDPLDDDFYYGSFYSPGFRAARLKALLPEIVADGVMTRARAAEMQLEVFSPWADRMIPMLDEAIAALDGGDPALAEWVERDDLRAAAERLRLWDRRMTLESSEATLFRMFGEYAARDILADDLGVMLDAIAQEQPVYLAKFALLTLERGVESLLDAPRDVVLLRALDAAHATFTARGEPAWGTLHDAVFFAPDRSERTLPIPGGDSSLNVAQSRCWADGDFAETCRTTAGAVYRFVTGFAEDGTPESDFACPACLPGSDAGWVAGEFIRLPFRRAEVEAAAAETIILR